MMALFIDRARQGAVGSGDNGWIRDLIRHIDALKNAFG
jgi:hypothetical protein